MNALTLLVDAANAESQSAVSSAIADAKNVQKQMTVDKVTAGGVASVSSASNRSSGLPGTGGANSFAATLAARENAIFHQIQQQQQGAAAKIRYMEEMRKEEQEQLSKERLTAIMLQREREQQQQASMHQATILRLMGRGTPLSSTPAPVGSASPQSRSAAPPLGTPSLQEAEYLQQLRLEALVQQHRQETLAKLAISHEMGYSNGGSAGHPHNSTNGSDSLQEAPGLKAVSKDVASHKYQRQDTALQKAILMARADEEMREQQLEHQQKAQHQREIEQQLEHEQHRQQQQQAAMLQLMSNGDSNSAFVNALRAAAAPSGHPGNGSSEDNAIMQLLEERERQRLMAQHNQQSQHRQFLPQAVPSSSAVSSASSIQLELQKQLQHHLQAQQQQQQQQQQQRHQHQHHGVSQGERADLIGSVFAKVAAAAASSNNNINHNNHRPGFHNKEPTSPSTQQQPIPSQVLSAIAAAEGLEKNKLLQLQQHHQNSQESFQSSGVMMDAVSHSQQQQQHQQRHRLQQQALAHHQHMQQQQQQQEQAAALAQQQQEAIKLSREMLQQQQQPLAPKTSDSKSTILPCRARGMPMDHNVKTAYFVIPPNIRHGTELLCSYFACRNAGIKFRYCVYCKLPVAKRNFAKRHRHSGKIPDNEVCKEVPASNSNSIDSGLDDESKSSSQHTEQPEKAQQEEPKPQEKEDPSCDTRVVDPPAKDETSHTLASATIPVLPSETLEIKKDPCGKVISPICGDDCETLSSCEANYEEASNPEAESSKQDSDSKAKDPETIDSGETNEMSPTRDPSPVDISLEPSIDTNNKQQKAWGELLLKRPKTERPNSDAMLAWIRDVLRVSNFGSEVESDGSRMEDDNSDSEVQTDASPSHGGDTTRKSNENRPLSAKKSKTKSLLSRKEQEDMEQTECSDKNTGGKSSSIKNEKDQQGDEESPREDIADKASGKRNYFPDDMSTSSEESVDLRVRKKSRN